MRFVSSKTFSDYLLLSQKSKFKPKLHFFQEKKQIKFLFHHLEPFSIKIERVRRIEVHFRFDPKLGFRSPLTSRCTKL